MANKKGMYPEELLQEALVPEEEQPYKVPDNWLWVRMGTITEINPPKYSPEDNDDTSPTSFVPMSAVSEITGTIEEKQIREYKEVKKGYTSFIEGDVLFAKITPCMENGKAALAEGLLNGFGFGSTEFHVFRPKQVADNRYIYHMVRSKLFRAQAKAVMTGAVGQQRVPKAFLEEYPLALPPIPEQKRIVTKVESLLSKISEAKQLIEEARETFAQRRAAILAKAFRGELTKNWRKSNTEVENASKLLRRIVSQRRNTFEDACNKALEEGAKKPKKNFKDVILEEKWRPPFDLPDTWTITNIDFLAHVTKLAGFEYTKYIKLEDNGEIPVVRAQNVQMGRFVEENIKYISKETSDFLERSQLFGREILMVFIGAGTGNVCMVPRDKRWHLAPNVAKIDIDGVVPEYVCYYLQSPIGLENTLSWAKATAQPSLSMETIRKIAVILPPVEEQREIVNRINSLMKLTEKIESNFNQAVEQIDNLIPLVLNQAFRGELGTNDSLEESVLRLLEEVVLG